MVATFGSSVIGDVSFGASGAVFAAGRCGLGPALVAGFLDDRRDLGIVEEALEALFIPVEEHPDPILLVGIAEDGRALGPVLLPLLGTLRREDLRELVEVLDRRCSQEHQSSFQEVGRAAARGGQTCGAPSTLTGSQAASKAGSPMASLRPRPRPRARGAAGPSRPRTGPARARGRRRPTPSPER